MRKKIVFWTLAVVITLLTSVFQRATGPTNPKKAEININGHEYKLKFQRAVTTDNPIITFGHCDNSVQGVLYWREHNSNEPFKALNLVVSDGKISAVLPEKEKLTKIDYYVQINDEVIFRENPLVLRYKDPVPVFLLIVHIVFMFAAMLFAVYGIFLGLDNNKKVLVYLHLTLWNLILGGIIIGAAVQKYAFGVYWSGFPFGMDITDNKTLLATLLLLAALPLQKKKYFRYFAVAAFAMMFVVFFIPHSV
ncbi:MAG: hypothetical protein LBR17_00705 [Bacteroidales bacterium]|jgi:hypothetical protein|nr:hypothetical protein [Bacteroidales bacterium]